MPLNRGGRAPVSVQTGLSIDAHGNREGSVPTLPSKTGSVPLVIVYTQASVIYLEYIYVCRQPKQERVL